MYWEWELTEASDSDDGGDHWKLALLIVFN